MGGADELHIAGAPSHAFGNRQLRQGPVDEAGEQLGGGLAWREEAMRQPAAPVGLYGLQLRHGGPAGAGEACRRRGGLAVRVISRRQGRPALLHLLVRLRQGKVRDHDGKPPRGGEPGPLPMLQVLLAQAAPDAVGKRGGQGLQGLGRQLLDADLHQQGSRFSHGPDTGETPIAPSCRNRPGPWPGPRLSP